VKNDALSQTPACSPSPSVRSAGAVSGTAPILTAAVLWGTTGTASTFVPAGVSSAAVGSAGLALGGLLLFLSARSARTLPRTCTRGERWLLFLGAVTVAGYPVTFYPAVARCGVAVATVIALGSAPVFTGLLAWLTRQAKPTARWACATAAAVIGCTALVLAPSLATGAAPSNVGGMSLATLAGLSYAAYALIGGKLISRGHPSHAVVGAMFGVGAVLVLPVLLSSDPRWLATFRGAAVAAYLAAVTTFLCYRLFGYGLRHTAAQAATTLTLAEPAVATVLGVAALGERLPALSWAGLVVLAAGLVILTFPQGIAGRLRRPGSPCGREGVLSAVPAEICHRRWPLLLSWLLGRRAAAVSVALRPGPVGSDDLVAETNALVADVHTAVLGGDQHFCRVTALAAKEHARAAFVTGCTRTRLTYLGFQ
jgi:DME family drug/metabolite transporter